MLAHCTVRGIAQGVLPLIGYNYAAGDWKRVRSAVTLSTLLSVGIAAACMGVCLLFSPQLIGIFIRHASPSLQYGADFLRILCVGAPFSACAYACISFFQATACRFSQGPAGYPDDVFASPSVCGKRRGLGHTVYRYHLLRFGAGSLQKLSAQTPGCTAALLCTNAHSANGRPAPELSGLAESVLPVPAERRLRAEGFACNKIQNPKNAFEPLPRQENRKI